jgi:hypothetical protein
MLAGIFRLSCLYVFDNDLGSYMIYNLAVIFVLSYLGTYEHVDHPFCIHVNIYDAMLQLFIIIHVITMQSLFFRIKLCRKLSKSLTIQKPNIRQFSLSGFAATLKPNQFDGKNFMIWRARMELWLTAMNCYHAT